MIEQLHTIFVAGDLRHVVLIVGIGLTIWAAASDLLRFKIPNRISAALFVAGTVWVIVSGSSPGLHLAAAACVFALCFLAYLKGAFGAGDAKLLTALALWMGPEGAIVMVILTALAGGVLAIAWTMSRPVRVAMIAARVPIDPQPPAQIPYGIAIGAAALYSFGQLWPALS